MKININIWGYNMQLVKCDFCGKVVEKKNANTVLFKLYDVNNDKNISNTYVDLCGECYYIFSVGEIPNIKGANNDKM